MARWTDKVTHRLSGRVRQVARRLLRRGGTPYDDGAFRALARMRDWRPDDVIIDVGANDGRTILRWRQYLGPTQVYAFEPVQATFDTLRRRTTDMEGVHLFRCALGAEAGHLPIYLDDHSALNSLRPAGGDHGQRQEMVKVDTLDAVMERQGIARAELLKIDAEEFDLEVLCGARRALSEGRFRFIQVEAGFSAPGPQMASLAEMQSLLAGYGYHLNRITNQCSARLHKLVGDCGSGGNDPDVLVYCDALFVAGRTGAAAAR